MRFPVPFHPRPFVSADEKPGPGAMLGDREVRRMLHRATLVLVLSLGVPLLALLGLVLVLLRSAAWVNHTDQVIAQADDLERMLVSMQTSFRGYRLANEEAYLARMVAERQGINPARENLLGLVSDSPKQRAQVEGLEGEIVAWTTFLDGELAELKAHPELIHDASFMRRGVPLFDATQMRLRKIIAEEQGLRAARDAKLRAVVTALFVVLGLGALVGIPSLTFWLQWLVRELGTAFQVHVAAAEQQAREWQVTLHSIGDAVVATDARGRVEFLNPAAETLTGWRSAEARGRELADVFEIFQEETGRAVENPVAQVLAQIHPIGLANHTILRARDGREVPIEDSAAPIRNEQGEIAGVILVFHDATQKRAAERSLVERESRLRFLNELGEATRRLTAAREILEVTTRLLGEHLRVSRCAYAEVEPDGEHFSILHDFVAGDCPSSVGDFAFAGFGAPVKELLHRGTTLVIRDLARELPAEPGEAAFRALAVQALICCPLVKAGNLRAWMAVHQTTPRAWSAAEISLVEEVVERCWATIERARSEGELHASETLKTAILETSIDGFVLLEHTGRIVDWNSAAERIFGRSRADVLGRSLSETIVPERLREAHERELAHYLATGESEILGRRIEAPGRRADGSEIDCEIAIARIPGTMPPLFAGSVRDITERKNQEAALRAASERAEAAARAVAESAERFRLLAEVVSLQVWTARPDGELDFVNGECHEYFGVESDLQLLGNAWTQFVLPDDLPGVAETWSQALATGERYEAEFRLRRADGTYRWFLVRAQAMRDLENRPARWFGTNTDIDDLKAAQREAEHASRAKDDFLAVLSHELRTPLTPVLLTAAALRDDERLPADARAQLGMMERNIGLEARLIDDLLDLTRIAKGKLPLRPQPCDAHSLIGLAVEIVRDEAQAKGILLAQSFDALRSGLVIDPSRFQQVIWNLLRNAVKFTPTGGRITISTRDLPGPDGRPWLQIGVDDSGIGIEPEAIERIFQPFEQARVGGDHRFGGIGLGLAIARAIVDLQGGILRAESEGPGMGATFTVELPGADVPDAGVENSPEDDLFLRGGAVPAPAAAKNAPSLRLLLVEDHEATLQVLARLLTRAGHKVIPVSSVAAALTEAARHHFDGVISDLGLPDGTGHALMTQLRDRYHLRGIALTGYGMEEDLERTRKAGFATHLIKPVEFEQLRRSLSVFTEPRPASA